MIASPFPTCDDSMPPEVPADTVVEQQLRQACARLDRELRSGADCRCETLFAEFPPLADHADAALELIYTEFVTREELGQKPAPEDYYARFPKWRAELHEQFRVHLLLREPIDDRVFPATGADDAIGPGRMIGSYEILEKIAQGSMAAVFKARQEGLNRVVALKMLLPGAGPGRAEHARLRIEAEAVARLQHPNIVQIFEIGECEGRFFLSLEFVTGGSLDQQLGGTPRSASYASQLLETLARAIHSAHQRGIVHRDLKPANILLEAHGSPSLGLPIPKITDFGLAKLLDRAGGTHSTERGAVFGTPSYMAPEQAEGAGRSIRPAADIYALGAILYEVLTGRPPFRAETLLTTLRQVVSSDPVPPDVLQPSVPRDLATICMKCLQKDPRRRYSDAGALAEDLRRFRAGEPIHARPIGLGQRSWKWARRHPSTAALLAVVGFALGAIVFGNLWYTGLLQNETRRAHEKETESEAAAQEAQKQKAEVFRQAELYRQQLESTRRSLYTIQLAQVETQWRANSAHALELLNDPVHCPADLRDFAWRMYHHLCNQDRHIARAHDQETRLVAFSPDGQTLATAALREPVVKLWDAITLRERGTLKGHTNGISCLAFSPDGETLASGSEDRTIRLWDVETQSERACLRGHTGIVAAFSFSQDSRTLISGGHDGTVRQWTVRDGKTKVIHKQSGAVRSLALSLDGKVLAAGDDKIVRMWDLKANRELPPLALENNGPATSLAISPDGRKLAVAAARSPLVSLWDLRAGAQHVLLRGHVDRVHVLVFSPDGSLLATGSEDRTVRLWDVETGAESLGLHGPAARVRCLAFSPDGKNLASAGGDEGIRVWSMASRNIGRDADRDPTLPPPLRITAMAYAPDGQTLAVGLHDGSITLYEGENFSERGTLRGHQGTIWSLAFAPREPILASGGEDGTIRLWNATTQEEIATLFRGKPRTYSLVFSPDGKILAAACESSGLRIWEVETRKELSLIDLPNRVVDSVAISPDGKTLAVGCLDGAVILCDLKSGKKRTTLDAHQKAVLVAVFNPDGKSLLTGGMDSNVKLWNLETSQPRAVIHWQTGYVFSAAFTPDGRTLAVGGGSRSGSFLRGEVKLYNVATGHCRATLPGQTGPVAFAPDGQSLLTVERFSALKRWLAPSAEQPEPPAAD